MKHAKAAGAGASAGGAGAGAERAAIPGVIRLQTQPAGAEAFLDGRRVAGATPLLLDGLESGVEHLLVVQLDGYHTAERRLKLRPGEVKRVLLKLRKQRTPPAVVRKERRPKAPPVLKGFGFLNVTSEPWCNISIDGKGYGQTPRAGIRLSAGPHTLVCTNDAAGFRRTARVSIEPDGTVRKRFSK
jgi:hypothetical protein